MPSPTARLARLAEDSADLLFEIDARGVVQSINEAGAAFFGRTPEEVVGLPGDAGVVPDARPRLRTHVTACFRNATRPSEPFDVPVIDGAGRTRWLSCRLHPTAGPDGRVTSLQVIAFDITAHIEARAAARMEADRLRLLSTVTSESGPFAERVRRALTLTTTLLGYETGILSQIQGATYTVVACHAPGAPLAPGDAFELGQTYCDLTLQTDDLLEIGHMDASVHRTHPCYRASALESYVGIPIRAHSAVVGTLNFSSSTPAAPLRPADLDLIRVLAMWIGSETEKEHEVAARTQQSERLRALLDATSTAGPFDDQAAVVLTTLCRLLGLESSVLASLDDTVYTCLASASLVGAPVARGATFPRQDTYCTHVLAAGDVVAIESADTSPLRAERCTQLHPLGAYIGVPVASDGPKDHVLCVTSSNPLAQPFSDADRDLLRLAAQWAGSLLDRTAWTRQLAEQSEQLGAILRQAPLSLFAFDSEGRMTLNEGQAARAGGQDPTALLGRSMVELFAEHPAIVDGVRSVLDGEPAAWQVDIDGTHFDVHAAPSRDDAGTLVGGIGVGLDVSEHVLAQAQVREAEERFRTLSTATFEGIFLSENDVIIDVNEQAARLFGYGSTLELIGRSARSLLTAASAELWMRMILENRTEAYEAECLRADGSTFWAEVQGRPLQHRGRTVRMTAIRDVSARKAAEAQTRFQADVLAHVSDAVMALDHEGRVTYWNAGAEQLHGLAAEAVLGRPLDAVVHYTVPDDGTRDGDPPASGETGDLLYTTPDGALKTVAATTSSLLDAHGAVRGVLTVARDVTESRAMASRLHHQATHDALTGLPNRVRFREGVQQALRSGAPFVTLFVDLDRFKGINDSLGHDAGDRLLAVVADRMRDAVAADTAAGGMVARLGGDEFAVLLPGDVARAERLADALLAALTRPIDIGGHVVTVGASIGLVHDGHTYPDPEALLRDADTAMYQAKHKGRGQFVRFDRTMHEAAALRFGLENDLRAADLSDQLRLRLQPILDLTDGRVAGFESLVRWEHPVHGLVAPDRFVPLAEDLGLIQAIDRWVLAETCRTVGAWTEAQGFVMVSVNCSDQSFLSDGLATWARAQADAADLDPSRLVLELTERALVETGAALGSLASFRREGLQLCVDDFGSGYSSLGLLHALPVDSLKIDRSFVMSLESSASARAVVRAVVGLTDDLGLRAVAEGIETQAQLGRLRDAGCRYGQGYLFSRPVAPDEARALVASRPWQPLFGPAPAAGRYSVTPLLT